VAGRPWWKRWEPWGLIVAALSVIVPVGYAELTGGEELRTSTLVLHPAVQASAEIESGTCSRSATSLRFDARSCATRIHIYDPCFEVSDGIAACAAGLTPGEWVWVSPIVDAPWPEWMILDEDPVPLEEVTARTYPWAVQLVSGEWCRLSFWVSADSVGVGEHAYNCTRPPEAYIAFPDHRRFYSERRHLQVTTEEDEDRLMVRNVSRPDGDGPWTASVGRIGDGEFTETQLRTVAF